jgi:pyruvate carboxylase
MYPKVFTDYMAHRRKYGDVSSLPTPVFFYGLSDQEEMAVDIDQGKTLVVSLLGEMQEKDSGETRLFFELNGQPRPVRVQRAGQSAAARKTRSKAHEGNSHQVGAPMPGAVAVVSVKPDQKVTRGSPLVSIEAMKMENTVSAYRDGIVARVHVAPGDRVEAKDLLVEFEPVP